ncbi:MAG: sigma-70 family RNA polymerase sigma factor [Chloroflexota bacterium]
MTRLSFANRTLQGSQDEMRLVGRVRAGHSDAFLLLFDVYVEPVYRYVYFLASDDIAAENILSRVFIRAWEDLKRYRFISSPFAIWLYKIARNQISEYYKIHPRTVVLDDGVALAARRRVWDRQFQGTFDPQAVRDTLQLLNEEEQQVMVHMCTAALPLEQIARMMGKREGRIRELQLRAFRKLGEIHARKEVIMSEFQKILEDCLPKVLKGTATVEECLARYPEYASQLRPLLRTVYTLGLAGALTPAPVMNTRTREKLGQYLRFHPRSPQRNVFFLRTAMAVASLVLTFLITGTAYAQTAMPGDSFYGWKRTSEQVWRTVSLDPVATDIEIANRRLDELIATADDPQLKESALASYVEVMDRLKAQQNSESLARVMQVIEVHHDIVDEAGLAGTEVESVVVAELENIPVIVATEVAPTVVPPTATIVAVEPTLPPTSEPTLVPTEVPPTATPTEIPPTATEVPPTATPTEPPPTATPTEIAPTATSVIIPPNTVNLPPDP